MRSNIARAEHVSKSYRLGSTTVAAVRDVSLDVAAAELVALSGPSGSGKSTLLNLIGCLDRPDQGDVWLTNRPASALSSRALAGLRLRHLGFVFQSFNLVPVLTAFENVEYPLLLAGTPARESRERVGDVLARVGLSAKMHRRPDELSGGERQRVAIVRALINRPVLVLADEPTANLDSVSGEAVLDLMHELRDQYDVAFLVASHDPRVLARMDRVVTIRDGAVVDDRCVASARMELTSVNSFAAAGRG
jgi:putative ABC transport system ATP-binding protein